MAQEAINIIKTAEEEAKNIINTSEVESDKIISDAINNQKDTKQRLSAELKEQYDEAIAKAKNAAIEESNKSIFDAQKEADELTTKLMTLKGKAIAPVLERILEG